MTNFLKYITKKLISAILHIFWLFPVEKNKIFLMNDHSYSFSDNLKYLSIYLQNKDPYKYKIYFSLKDTNEVNIGGIIAIKFLSFNHFFHAITSGTIITNNSGIVYLPIRKNQLVINTWHGGGPYKVTGLDALDNFWYERELQYSAQKFDYILSSCEVCSKVEAPGMYYRPEQIVNSGMPRMDYFFDKAAMKESREKVMKEYEIDKYKKLVLYAPTFRGFFEDYDGVISGRTLELDYHRLKMILSIKFGGEWEFAVRLHPRLKGVEFNESDLINMTSYPDAEELLMAADVLITDYSSVMWDFSFSRKPIFIFATDINDYEVQRGFYITSSNWPYPIATNNDELDKLIREFEYDVYINKLENHYKEAGSYETGTACEIVRRLIDKHIEENK